MTDVKDKVYLTGITDMFKKNWANETFKMYKESNIQFLKTLFAIKTNYSAD